MDGRGAGRGGRTGAIRPAAGWETVLLTDAEVLDVLVGLLSPLLFGVVLPLVE